MRLRYALRSVWLILLTATIAVSAVDIGQYVISFGLLVSAVIVTVLDSFDPNLQRKVSDKWWE